MGREGGGELGRVEGGETMVDALYERRIFSIRKKRRKNKQIK